jgi:hypothetical protein
MHEASANTKPLNYEREKVRELYPQYLREGAANIISFLEEYYEYLNQDSGPSYELRHITIENDIDETSEKYLDAIQGEIAKIVPNSSVIDRNTLYKRIVHYYKIKGTPESVEIFFKLFFDAAAELYFPGNDLFKLSAQENGQLSHTKKIQDSLFWQDFSYQIATTVSSKDWEGAFKRIVHPAGMKFFSLLLIDVLIKNRWEVFESYSPSAENPESWYEALVPPSKRITNFSDDGYHTPRYQPGWLESTQALFVIVLLDMIGEDPIVDPARNGFTRIAQRSANNPTKTITRQTTNDFEVTAGYKLSDMLPRGDLVGFPLMPQIKSGETIKCKMDVISENYIAPSIGLLRNREDSAKEKNQISFEPLYNIPSAGSPLFALQPNVNFPLSTASIAAGGAETIFYPAESSPTIDVSVSPGATSELGKFRITTNVTAPSDKKFRSVVNYIPTTGPLGTLPSLGTYRLSGKCRVVASDTTVTGATASVSLQQPRNASTGAIDTTSPMSSPVQPYETTQHFSTTSNDFVEFTVFLTIGSSSVPNTINVEFAGECIDSAQSGSVIVEFKEIKIVKNPSERPNLIHNASEIFRSNVVSAPGGLTGVNTITSGTPFEFTLTSTDDKNRFIGFIFTDGGSYLGGLPSYRVLNFEILEYNGKPYNAKRGIIRQLEFISELELQSSTYTLSTNTNDYLSGVFGSHNPGFWSDERFLNENGLLATPIEAMIVSLEEQIENLNFVRPNLSGVYSVQTGVEFTVGSLTVGQEYMITDLGTTPQADWNTIAGTTGVTYIIGDKFTAASNTGTGNGTAIDFRLHDI